MAKPERLTAGFELANGRAADRVSEKEAEAGRSRRRSRTTSATASPWHDPGHRLQRLHKEAFLGAAVSLLVRGLRWAGPQALRGAPQPLPGLVPRGGMAPAGVALACSPRARSASSRQNLDPRPAHRRGPPPANGRAGCLPPHLATGGARLASLLPSGRASPFSLWAETASLLPAGGWSSLLSADGDWPRALSPAGGRRPVRPSLPAGLGTAVICPLVVGSAVPRDRLRLPEPAG